MRVEDFRALVATRLLGVYDLEEDALLKLTRHHELYDRWLQRNDRTAVRDTGDAVERDYCESIFVAAYIDRVYVPRGTKVIADIGSGAGFPGSVIAAVLPHVTVHVVEADQHKALFLRDSTRGWPNVKVRSAKAQNLPDQFDLLVSRGMPSREMHDLLPKLSSQALVVTSRAEGELLGDEPGVAIPWAPQRVLVPISPA